MIKALQKFRLLGPGLLFAGAAIGVSHLVQSTRAGAEYGTTLIWAVLLANLMKFPFFEFGPRYAAASGESLIAGYRRLGYWVLILFLLVSLGTVFTIQAAVTAVTAALASGLLPLGQASGLNWSIIILAVCALVLFAGHYKLLDRIIKWIIIVLSVTTIVAFVSSLGSVGTAPDAQLMSRFSWTDAASITFLIALMGWMPAPLDLSVWHSLWTLEKQKIQPDFKLSNSIFDFRVGYVGTAILALCFLGLGAGVMYGRISGFPPDASGFASLLFSMYTSALGPWAVWIVIVAALCTMFSTTITCLDAIPRVLSHSFVLLQPKKNPQNAESSEQNSKGEKAGDRFYWVFLLILGAGALVIIRYFSGNLKSLIELATILSFLTSPFFALANYLLVTGKHMPPGARPSKSMRWLSFGGLVFLTGFSLFYLINTYL